VLARPAEAVDPLPADGTRRLFSLGGALPSGRGTLLLRLRLGGEAPRDNWYWVPPKLDKFEMGGCFTGCKVDKFADMRDLAGMPTAAVHATLEQPAAPGGPATVTVRNTGAGIAFFVRVRALGAGGDDVLPARWSDNFVTLLGGESVALTLRTDERVAHVTAEPFNA
jgi:exo-1,4-beta-D-glucosaminidase